MTVMLDISREEYVKLRASECVFIIKYVNEEQETTRAWIEIIGTRQECEEASGNHGGKIFVVPKGLHLESELVDSDKILAPGRKEESVD